MKRSLYLFSIFLFFLGIFAVHFTVYMAYADDATTVKGSKSNSDNRQVQPTPKPVDGTTETINLNSSKSNVYRQVQPTPGPAEGTTKSTKSNSSE